MSPFLIFFVVFLFAEQGATNIYKASIEAIVFAFIASTEGLDNSNVTFEAEPYSAPPYASRAKPAISGNEASSTIKSGSELNWSMANLIGQWLLMT